MPYATLFLFYVSSSPKKSSNRSVHLACLPDTRFHEDYPLWDDPFTRLGLDIDLLGILTTSVNNRGEVFMGNSGRHFFPLAIFDRRNTSQLLRN